MLLSVSKLMKQSQNTQTQSKIDTDGCITRQLNSQPEFILYAAMETLLLKAAKKPKPVMIQRCLDSSEGAQK